MTKTEKLKEGWGFPLNSKKMHYFIDGRSPCGKWMFFGNLESDEWEDPLDCKECRKRLNKRKEKEVKTRRKRNRLRKLT